MTWLQAEVVVVDGWELEICSNLPTSKPASIESLLSCRRPFTRCKLQVYKALQQQNICQTMHQEHITGFRIKSDRALWSFSMHQYYYIAARGHNKTCRKPDDMF